jgi:hypothetical protein
LEKELRYERSTRVLMANRYYNDFIRRKIRLRKIGTRKMIYDELLSSLLLSLKALLIFWDYTFDDCVKDIYWR